MNNEINAEATIACLHVYWKTVLTEVVFHGDFVENYQSKYDQDMHVAAPNNKLRCILVWLITKIKSTLLQAFQVAIKHTRQQFVLI